MVLAAGLGTRMRPLTLETPKPLITVGGKPLIDHMLDRLASVGVETVVINVHWLAEKLEAHVRARTDLKVIISDERGQLMETGGGLVQARSQLGNDPIFVCNTDQTWLDQEAFERLGNGFDASTTDATLLLARKADCMGFHGKGDFNIGLEGRLTRRPEGGEAPYVYAGAQIIQPSAIDGHPLEPFSANRIWDVAISKGRLRGETLSGKWLHVGDPEALAEANAFLASQ
jgi:N-acetyl-alpha-D-muramate 1-phosphate uridylyltransferase